MLVPVLIDQRPCYMQLDTGMPRSVAWHEYSGESADKQPVDVQFAGRHATVEASKAVRDLVSRCQPGVPIGSLGNEFFEEGTLSIDLRNRSVAYQAGSALREDRAAAPFFYSTLGPGGAHVVIQIGIGEQGGTALLDTGSAALDVGAFGPDNWHRLTRGAPLQQSDSVAVFEVPAWGKQHQCFKTSSAVPLRITPSFSSQLAVTYCPTIGFKGRADLVGVVGMNPFLENVVVIDYPARLWSVRKSVAKVD